MYTATYSPEDNKLRLYAATRLDKETYDRVKAAGFKWAPKQELFVAPMWTPEREDLLLELAGEIGDEDTSLVERQEARAERFEDYSDSRQDEANVQAKRAHDLAYQINGQPILVGHHSEKRARRDQERIMDWSHNACTLWKTSEYWKSRAAGAIRLAKYKERPDVRARRIKVLEADQRKQERNVVYQDYRIKVWSEPMDTEKAKYVAGRTNTTDMDTYFGLDKGTMTPEEAKARVLEQATQYKTSCERWIAHLQNRITYEKAMLADAGGTVADRNGPEVGGACRCWCTRGQWSEIKKVNKVSVTVMDNYGNGGKDFPRTIPFTDLKAVISKAEYEEFKLAKVSAVSEPQTRV